MELTIEAIEADLLLAERHIGQAALSFYLTRAQVRATLLAAIEPPTMPTVQSGEPVWPPFEGNDVSVFIREGGETYMIPIGASAADREAIAARILGLDTLKFEVPSTPERDDDEPEDQEIESDFFAEERNAGR